MDRFVHAVGGYLPTLRLDRKAALAALRWSGLGGPREGRRAVAGWDEDAFTMATEAARGMAHGAVSDLVFASTSSYFTERLQSALIVDALALPRTARSTDVCGSRRCATTALMRALEGPGELLLTTAEKRVTQTGSSQQLAFGDGASACRVGGEGPVRYLGGASRSHDFVDVYASWDHPTPYAYEERFVRDVAARDILEPAIRAACERTGIEPGEIALAAFHEPVGGVYAEVARRTGLTAPNVAADLARSAGDLGAAHALFAFGLALGRAKPADVVLLVGFGGGCDAMLFEVQGPVPGSAEMVEMLQQGRVLSDYIRFLNLAGALDLAWGMRSETGQKAQATVLERDGRDIIGFIGGRDSTGNVQFPKSRIPVNPAPSAPDTLRDVRMADELGRIISVTSDRLIYTPDPPMDLGLVQFENGARLMMEFTERPEQGFAIGDQVRMRLRIKSQDKARGFRTYFWKAAPAVRAQLEA